MSITGTDASSISGPTGCCACGEVRYRLDSAPFDTGWCHCRLCRRSAGAPAIVFTSVPMQDFVILEGRDRLRAWRSTPFGERQFCETCGSLLTIRVDFQPETIDVSVATLDDPNAVAPGFHIFCEEAIAWAPIDDGLPRYARFRPETRGLPDGDTYPGETPLTPARPPASP